MYAYRYSRGGLWCLGDGTAEKKKKKEREQEEHIQRRRKRKKRRRTKYKGGRYDLHGRKRDSIGVYVHMHACMQPQTTCAADHSLKHLMPQGKEQVRLLLIYLCNYVGDFYLSLSFFVLFALSFFFAFLSLLSPWLHALRGPTHTQPQALRCSSNRFACLR